MASEPNLTETMIAHQVQIDFSVRRGQMLAP